MHSRAYVHVFCNYSLPFYTLQKGGINDYKKFFYGIVGYVNFSLVQVLVCMCANVQTCQLSRIERETHAFSLHLPLSRLVISFSLIPRPLDRHQLASQLCDNRTVDQSREQTSGCLLARLTVGGTSICTRLASGSGRKERAKVAHYRVLLCYCDLQTISLSRCGFVTKCHVRGRSPPG